MTDKEQIMIGIEDNPMYLKRIIKHLIELNNYPDININYFLNTFGADTRIEAELILCTGGVIIANTVVSTQELLKGDFKNYIEEYLLKEVAYKYIKRAFEKRKTDKVEIKASNFLRSCQGLWKGNE